MKKSSQFDNILDECLERLLTKGETLEQCLESYLEQAAELRPLLETALATQRASAIQPRPEFKARAEYQFRSALQAIKSKRPFFGWQQRWATAMAIVLVLLLAGGGTVAAASNSMPDAPLYTVKLATEQVQLTLTPSALGKAELYASLADKRVAEIVYIANKGDTRRLEMVSQRLGIYLAMIAYLVSAHDEEVEALMPQPSARAPGPPDTGDKPSPTREVNGRARLRLALARYAINHPAALRTALEKAPQQARPALLRAIAISVVGYEKALEAAGN